MESKRFTVRKLDFGQGYVIVSPTGDKLGRTWNTHYRPVKEKCDRLNAKLRRPQAKGGA